jgi:hypothetical protein
MRVEDSVHLVSALRRLVHALAEAGDHSRCGNPPVKEGSKVGAGKAATGSGGRAVRRDLASGAQGVLETIGMPGHEIPVGRPALRDLNQKPGEQHTVHARGNAEVQVGAVGGHGAARIDGDNPRTARRLGLLDTLIEHRMAPSRVGTDENHEIGLVEIFVAIGHDIGAESALVASDGRGHAEARIGVDIGRTDEPLHQLVGDVVVLGQQLAGEIERHGIGTMRLDCLPKAVGDGIEGSVPGGAHAVNGGVKKAPIRRQRLAECRTLDAEPAAIGGMVFVTGDRGPAHAIGRGSDAATDAAIGACGFHDRLRRHRCRVIGHEGGHVHSASLRTTAQSATCLFQEVGKVGRRSRLEWGVVHHWRPIRVECRKRTTPHPSFLRNDTFPTSWRRQSAPSLPCAAAWGPFPANVN